MTDAASQKALWEVRKAGLNIMMSMHGDGKPVSFIEDCAVPLEHLADYVDTPDRGVREARHARHVVRACIGRHAARAADPRHAPRRRAEDARDRRRSGAMVREYKGAFSGEHGDGLVRSEWVGVAVRPAADARVRGDQVAVRSRRPDESRQDRQADARWTTRGCFAIRRAIARSRCRPRSTGRRGTCRTIPRPKR